jgi:glycosyltransferase involved in cell wall biosynthesis
MIGVVIPVHNEEAALGACLEAVAASARHPGLGGEDVLVVVALDACTDGSKAIAQRACVEILEIDARRVGAARASGAALAVAFGARWLAFTDADTLVSPAWLATQVALDADAVCGTVGVDDWSRLPPHVPALFRERYRDHEGHGHVHGANFGVSAKAYLAAGGFRALAVQEDVSLVQSLIRAGFRVLWSAKPRVMTSTRLQGRLTGGFATYLAGLAAQPGSA